MQKNVTAMVAKKRSACTRDNGGEERVTDCSEREEVSHGGRSDNGSVVGLCKWQMTMMTSVKKKKN